jgi:glycerophosphoryl diester phosphodiesterase
MSGRPDLFGVRPFVVAHRGGAAEAPENTLRAFRRAIDAGFPWAECDVRALVDGTPVVVHDAEVRVGGTARDAPVASLTRARWAAVDLSAHLGPSADGERAPTFADLVALPWGRTKLMIEVKPDDREAELGRRIALEAAQAPGSENCLIASFSPGILRAVRAAVPDLAVMGLLDRDTPCELFRDVAPEAFGADVALVTPRTVAAWGEGGRAVWSWTVKRADQAPKLIAAGVRGLITDVPTAVAARVL